MLEPRQATGPKAVAAAPTSPRLSRQGAAQPQWVAVALPKSGFCVCITGLIGVYELWVFYA